MALTFPISLASLVDLLMLETATPNLMRQEEFSGLGSGEGISHDLAPPLWEFDCATVQFPHRDVDQWRARFLALDGSVNTFLIYPIQAPYPSTDIDGSELAGSTITVEAIQSNRKELSLQGVPADFVFPFGAFLSITYDTSRIALVTLVSAATAAVDGTTDTFEVRPHLRPGIAAGDAVSASKPVCKVKLLPGTLRVEQVGPLHSRLRFTARQTLAA